MRLFFIFLTLLILTACSKPEVNKLTLVVPQLTNPFFKQLADAAQQQATKLNIELRVKESDGASVTELDKVSQSLDWGTQALLIVPSKSNNSVHSIRLANSRDIPVITIDRNVNDGVSNSHIASDNLAGGRLVGEFISAMSKGKGSVAQLVGPRDSSVTLARSQGLTEVIENTELTLLESYFAGFSRNKAKQVTLELLHKHPNLTAIFAHNDEMALGALDAIRQLKTDLILVGFDGTRPGVAALSQGLMDATIAQQPELMGQLAVTQAYKLLSGEKITDFLPVDLKLIQRPGL